MSEDKIPNTNELNLIYNLDYIPDYLKIKADEYINTTYGSTFSAFNDPADEEFYCI